MDALIKRQEIPFLRDSGINYLDSAATSLTPLRVINRLVEYYCEVGASAGRSAHRPALKATSMLENARETTATFFNCGPPEVIFTYNATDAINSVAIGLDWRPGDKIVTTLFEHHANLLPWYRLRDERGIVLEIVRPSENGGFKAEDFEKALESDNCRLLAFTHRSNVLGTELPARQIVEIAHRYGVLTLMDGAQSAPHTPIDLAKIDTDFFAGSAHKMLGPKGVGFLIVRRNAYGHLRPARLGGGIVKDVNLDNYELAEAPGAYEAGTQDVAAISGAAEALNILTEIGMDQVEKHDKELGSYLYQGLTDVEGVTVYGNKNKDERTGTCAFTIDGLTPHTAASLYDSAGKIAVRSGHHCALPVTKEYIKSRKGTIRASLYIYNDKADVDHFLEVTREISHKRRP